MGKFLLLAGGLIVTVSVVLHGASATPPSTLYGRAFERETFEEERESGSGGLFEGATSGTPASASTSSPRRWRATRRRSSST